MMNVAERNQQVVADLKVLADGWSVLLAEQTDAPSRKPRRAPSKPRAPRKPRS